MTLCKFSRWHKNYTLLLLLIMLLTAFAAINIGTVLFTGSRQLDLTSSGRYTLREPTLEWLKNNQKPILIRLYFSPDIEQNYPQLAQYARYLIKFLEQYQNNSNGKISLETIETTPFGAAETDASRFGIRKILDKNGRSGLYFGAVFSNNQGGSYTIPYFEPGRAAYLEHDVSRILSKLEGYTPPEIGIISPIIQIMSSADKLDSTIEWPFVTALKNDYQVTLLSSDTVQIPLKYKALIVFNPQNLAPMTVYALDQYLLRGGRLILLLDPFSEAYLNLNGHISPAFSNLREFLSSKNLAYSDTAVIGDKNLATPALLQNEHGSAIRNYPLWLSFSPQEFNPSSELLNGLQNLTFKSAGGLTRISPQDEKELISTTNQAGSVPADVAMYQSKAEIADVFTSVSKTYHLAVLQEGDFKSLYSVHPLSGSNYEQLMFPFLPVSVQPGKLLIITDSDFLFAPEWNAAPQKSGQGAYDFVPYNNNFDFIERAVDYFTDNNTHLLHIAPAGGIKRLSALGTDIRRKIEQNHAEEYALYNSATAQSEFELAQLTRQLAENRILSTSITDRRVEELTRRRDDNLRRLKELEFKLNQLEQQSRKQIIWLNLAAYPLGIILIIWIINRLRERRIRHRAEEYAHE